MELMIRAFRKSRGMTQSDLAREIGTTRRVISSYEREETPVPLDVACLIADLLDVSLDELAGRTEYVGTFSDDRQRRLNDDFASLDDASRDAAAAAVRGMAVACARGDDPAGSQADILSA